MKTVPLNQLFDIEYGNKFDLNKMRLLSRSDGGINFVNRSSRNCGVSATVAPIASTPPYEEGNITVSLGGSFLSSFVQLEKFYTGQNVAVLTAKGTMSFAEKLYVCLCIRHNRFRYSAFGREANRTLRTLPIPARSEFPSWLKDRDVTQLEEEFSKPQKSAAVALNPKSWKWFALSELFDIRKGKRLTKESMKPGDTPFISAVYSNNGLRQRISAPPAHPGNVITVVYNGKGGTGEAFYQPEPFFASDDVNVLYPKFALDAAVAIFICTIIRRERYRFNYGRKWNLERMNESKIRIPTGTDGKPDWTWMRRYILSRNFSSHLYEDMRDTEIAKERLAQIEAKPNTLVHGRELQSRLSRMDSVRVKP